MPLVAFGRKSSIISEMENLSSRPLDIVCACRAKDLPVLKLTAENLRRFVPFKSLRVYTLGSNFREFAAALGPDVVMMDEDKAIDGMTLEHLRRFPETGFPQGAGWYFQQFLKLSFAFTETENDYYLVWDADTIPLRPLQFFDDQGRMLFTKSTEHHLPYFETYKNLFGQDPHYEFSFISQHAIVRKSLLREMVQAIEKNIPGNEIWPWKIMRHLGGNQPNRFSEYETWGYYVKNFHPEAAVYRELPWSREGNRLLPARPSAADLKKLGESHAFVAFESAHKGLRRFLKPLLNRFAIPGVGKK
jgi:Family of unknown function (DUF6492)